jgi:hypothetical protein
MGNTHERVPEGKRGSEKGNTEKESGGSGNGNPLPRSISADSERGREECVAGGIRVTTGSG